MVKTSDECEHPHLSEAHAQHGHGCPDCGGEFPNPEECYQCAYKEAWEEAKAVTGQLWAAESALTEATATNEELRRAHDEVLGALEACHAELPAHNPAECEFCAFLSRTRRRS